MNNLNYKQVLTHLQNNFTVITPNNRLAKTLLEDYLKSSTQDVLEKPNCLSYDAFIQQLYFKFTHHNHNSDHPVLLTTQQTNYLWMKQLATETGSVHQGLLNKAYEAWSRCQLWQIDVNSIHFDHTEQTKQFQKWSNAFLLKLNQLNLITNELLIPYLIKQTNPCLPSQIVWFCFDEYTPLQTSLQQYFENQGIPNQHLDLSHQQCEQLLLAADDEQYELNTLINWLKQQLTMDQKRIGVVVPDLNQKASQLNRLLQRHFQKDQFNISLGKTLSDYALVAHALTWLGLDKRVLKQEHAALVLSSPFLAFSKEEILARAQFLQDNSLLQERVIDNNLFNKELTKKVPKLAAVLEAIANYPKTASPNTWITLFQERLAGLGFPGEYALDSSNYQCYQRLQLLFDEFKQLNLLVPTMSSYEAIKIMADLAQTTIFQPEQITAAPIQILGLLEAAGCQFDALWVIGMTDDCLPQKTKLSPFIPIMLQKEQGLPYTSPEKEFELAHKTITRFERATPTIVFSYPKYSDAQSNLPTPLLTNLTPFLSIEENMDLTNNHTNKIVYTETYQLPLDPTHPYQGSTSLLANQAKCPFRAFAAHRLHLKKSQETSEGPNALERGMIIHQIMEQFWQQVNNQHALLLLDEESLAKIIDNAINKAITPYQARRKYSFPPIIQCVERKRLKHLVEELLIWEKQRPDFSVTQVEENYSFELANIHFDVRIDRLDTVENNQKWVIDYKSTLPQKSPWQEDRPTEPQLLLYALLDDQINTILYIELKNGRVACKGLSEEDDKIKGIKTIQEKESWSALRKQWHQQLESLAKEFHDGECAPKPIHKSVCEQCSFSDLCRLPFND